MPHTNNGLQAAQQAMQIAYGADSRYNSVVSLGYRDRGTDCILPIGYIPTGEVDINKLAIRTDKDNKDNKSKNKDYYITANTLSRCYRCQDNLYSLRNIVIDIDCHADLTYQERQRLLGDYYARLQRDYPKLPKCNIVHYTGRGMQLWYCLNEIAGVWAWYYRIVVDKLVAILRHLQAEYSDFTDISIDSGASRNTVGYYRLFGSYNTRSQTQGIVTIIRDVRWDLDNLCKAIPSVDADLDSKPSVSAVTETEGDYHGLQYKRLSYLRWLQKHRNAPVGAEMRDIMLLLHYNAAKQIMSQDQAQAATLAFNRAFRQPLGRTDNIFDYLDTKGYLKFRVGTWCDFLQLTATERDMYMDQQSNATRDGQRSAKKVTKEQRDQQIIKMKKAGVTNLAIADELGIAVRTVYNVLQRQHYQPDNRKERILEYRAKGLQVMEICKLMEISKQTYYNILSKF